MMNVWNLFYLLMVCSFSFQQNMFWICFFFFLSYYAFSMQVIVHI